MPAEPVPMSPNRHSTIAMIVAAFLATAAAGCREEPGAVVITPADRIEQECPMDGPHGVVPDTLVLSGRLTKVPEFHDCQRFIAQSWKEYGSLYAIWVRDSLNDVGFPAVIGGAVPGFADSLGVPTVTGEPTYYEDDSVHVAAGPGTDAVGVAVAIVWSDGEPYEALGIKPGYNCLYMYGPPTWKAKMVPVANQKDCSKVNIDPSLALGTDLDVRAASTPGRDNSDYPPVARWDADTTGRYFIGIKCLAAWCEIGTAIGASPSYSGDRTRDIKGWYDEQYLAVRTTTSLRWPTTILGTMFPDPLLDSYTRNGFPKDTFVTVASTALGTGPGKSPPEGDHLAAYKTKFNFDPVPVSTSMNQIQFCRGSRAGCVPEDVVNPPNCAASDTLWARVVSATSTVVYRCITYTNHGVDMPGVVRWRWLANDEKGWVSCPSGCCQVNQ